MEDTISFGTIKNPRIQMADLVARECMKDLYAQIGPTKRERRKSMEALYSRGHFNFGVLDSNWMSACAHAYSRRGPEFVLGYKDWLSRKRRQDNWAARFEFIANLEAEGRRL